MYLHQLPVVTLQDGLVMFSLSQGEHLRENKAFPMNFLYSLLDKFTQVPSVNVTRVNGILHLTYSDPASSSSPIFWRALVTSFQVGDFLTHISRKFFRHSSSIPLLLVQISSTRSSSIPSASHSCCHLAVTVCRAVMRFSRLTEHIWLDSGWMVTCPYEVKYDDQLIRTCKISIYTHCCHNMFGICSEL